MSNKDKKTLVIILLVSWMSFFVISPSFIDNLLVSRIVNTQKITQNYQEAKRNLFFRLTEDWIITNYTQIDNQVILVNSNIIINSGGSFILNNSTLVFTSNELKNRIEVNTGGTLRIESNSRITSGLSENNYYIKIDRNGTFCSNNSEISYAGFAAGFDYTKSGVWINSENISINNTLFKENYIGLYLEDTNNTEIYNASFYDNYIGIYFFHALNISIFTCNITKSKNFGVVIASSENININNSMIETNDEQILVSSSHNIVFYNNTIRGNNGDTRFEDTSMITLLYNYITRNLDGINVRNSTQIDICYNNIVQNDGFALYLINSTNTTLKGNILQDNQHGISIEGVKFMNISENSLLHDSFVFINYSKDLFSSIHLSNSNIVNGLPIYLIYNSNNSEINNLTAGELLIMFSNNITVSSVNTSIEIYKASEIIIQNSTLSNGDYGIYIRQSQSVTLFNNTAEDNYVGIYLAFNNIMQIYNNSIKNNHHYGIFHKKCNNTVAYINFFINNTNQLFDNTATFWDNSTIGNFWDDYTGIDENNDGLGDTSYIIDEDSKDRFPIVLPDTYSPMIISINQHPESPNELNDVTIEVNVTDNVGIKIVILSSSENNTWVNTTMSYNPNKGLFVGVIDRHKNGTTITYKIYACDYAENWVVSDSYQYVVKYHELNPPTIQNITQYPEAPTDTDYVKIEVYITDDTNISSVFLQYSTDNVVWQNITMRYNKTNLFIGVIPKHKASTNVTYRIYATDVYNNSFLSGIISYTVLASDTNSPAYHEIKIVPTKPTELDGVIILANISDDNAIFKVTLRYSVNNVTWQNITMHWNTTIGLYQAIIPRQSAKTEIFFCITAQDSYGNTGVSAIYRYVVSSSDIKGPVIENIEYTPINPTERDLVKVTAQITDDSGVSVVILRVYNGNTWKDVLMKYNTTLEKFEGTISRTPLGRTIMFRIYANDTLGNVSKSQILSYKIVCSKEKNILNSTTLWIGGLTVTTVLIASILIIVKKYNNKKIRKLNRKK